MFCNVTKGAPITWEDLPRVLLFQGCPGNERDHGVKDPATFHPKGPTETPTCVWLYRVLQETWKISLEFGPNLFRTGSNYLVICEHSIACRRAGAAEENVSTPRAAGISRYIVNREAAS